MSKKSRRRKKNRRKFYNKKEFMNIFCNNCGICEGDPTFCYDEIYKAMPQVFLTKVRPNLEEVKNWNELNSVKGISTVLDAGQFRFAFCTALEGISSCGMDITSCPHMTTCYTLFKAQASGKKIHGQRKKPNRKEKKAKKYIAKPYPTLIISKDEKWEKFVKDTLSDGDIDRKQNKTETSAV